MQDSCEYCGAEDVKLYPYWEWMLCLDYRSVARENERINNEDEIKEDMRNER